MNIELSSKIIAVGNAFSTSVDGDLVLFEPDSGAYYSSSIVGEKIWSLVSEEKDVLGICDYLMEQFEVDRLTCEVQVIEFLNELHAHGLITVVH